ncbi:MAG TPA: adenylate/guanylate cyclase domain-containing protein [Thermoanaerobaculia bacterium]|nr:adenylate/guanylate cyclase domain-containing protein [Thermoanaerobaculia bacterium]
MKLVAKSGSLSVEIPPGRTLIVGRTDDCDLPIADPTVSRRHAELDLTDSGLRLRDAGSTNGTFVDGRRVSETVALPGAQIAFGKVAFELLDEQAPPVLSLAGLADAPMDGTIVRQMKVRGSADVVAQLADAPAAGGGVLRIGGRTVAARLEKKLSLLIAIAQELSQQAEVDSLLEKVVHLTFQVMNVDRVVILMASPSGELLPRAARNRHAGKGERVGTGGFGPPVPRSIARTAIEERVAVLIENAPDDSRFAGGSVFLQSVKSALCAPLLGRMGTVLGVIYLDNQAATHSFGDEDLSFLTAFSGIVAVAIENSQLIERVRREAVVLSNFQRYFAPDLARQIVGAEGEVQLGGSKREVVVLFSDIRGFTPLSEQMSPDEIASLLTEYFSEMVDVVFEHGGTLDKFIGDAVMALWGAPLARGDDADRAVRAAIAMQRRVDWLNAEWGRQGRQTIAVGIGLNAGEVFAGNIGSSQRLEYTVLGDPVNTASRLCSRAGGGEVLLSEMLYRRLAEPPPVRALDPMPLKGKAQAVQVFSVDLGTPSDTSDTSERAVVG